MAVSGTFVADFNDFYGKVDKANAKLSTMEAGGARAARSMDGLAKTGFTGAAKSLGDFDSILNLVGVHLGPARQALNELGNIAGQTVSSLGAMGTAGAIAGAAIGGWQLGRVIAEATGFDNVMQALARDTLGWGNSQEAAAAAADTLAKASETAGHSITNMAEAIKINEAAAKKAIEANEKLAASMHQGETAEKFTAQLGEWTAEYEKLAHSDVVDALTKQINSHMFSLADLAKQYGVSEQAMQLFAKDAAETARIEENNSQKLFDLRQKELKALAERQGKEIEAANERIKKMYEEIDAQTQLNAKKAEARNKDADDQIAANKKAAEDRIKNFDAEWEDQRKKRAAIVGVTDVGGVPGANLLGGKTVATFAQQIAQSGAPLLPGQTLASAALAAFTAAAAEALRHVAPVTVNVSGVWDNRSQTELTKTVSQGVSKAVGMTRPRSWV